MKTKATENWGTKELVNYLSISNEALRIENKKLMDENERLINNIEVFDAEIVSNNVMNDYYNWMNNFNFNLTK